MNGTCVRGLLLSSVVVALGIGCAPNRPPGIALAPQTLQQTDERLGLIIWVDAFDVEHFNALRRQGKLPNISHYLIDRGVLVEDAVASLPTITYANGTSFVTGLFPGHHNIPDNVWFDRYRLIFEDYTHSFTYHDVNFDFNSPTLYELLHQDFTATILTTINRGVTQPIYNWMTAGVSWFFGMHENINRLTTLRFEVIAQNANNLGHWPKVAFAYYTSPDAVQHEHGPRSQQYADILQDVDRQVGFVCQALEKAGLLEHTYITLVSDHGACSVDSTTDLSAYLNDKLGIPTDGTLCVEKIPLEARFKRYQKFRIVGVPSGRRRCGLHLRAQDQWRFRPSEQEVDDFARHFAKHPEKGRGKSFPQMLAELPATDIVTVRLDDNAVRIQSAGGIGVASRQVKDGKKLYRYQVTSGSDPLDYSARPATAALMDGEYHSGQEWFDASIDGSRPDVMVQLLELNDCSRAGDVALYAKEGWAFAPAELGGHGGLIRHEVLVPFLWAGPGLPHGAVLHGARTVDLMPTMLQLIGRGERIPSGLDGQDISARLKAATQPAAK